MVRSSTLLVSLLAAASSVAAEIPKAGKPTRPRVPGAYIFEYEDNQDLTDVHETIAAEGEVRMNLDYELFKGVSVQLNDIENAEAKAFEIASKPSIKNVWPVELYEIPKGELQWAGEPSAAPSSLQKRNNNAETTFPPHIMTQVEKLRAKGITGKGVKVAVLDTGIDYKHPALGGCFGEGCLVSFGTDLVGDDYTGGNRPVPDSDPMDCDGHGSHVAGTIAAQENKFGFTGAAPDVTLGAYKVFGCKGSSGNDVLISAFMQAYADGANIITASIGGPSGWPDEAWSAAVSAITKKGVPCTISAGNSGDSGLFYAASAAGGDGVAGIASFNNVESPTMLSTSKYTVDDSEAQTFGYTSATPDFTESIKLPLYAPDLDPKTPNGGCDPYPDNTPDLSGHIVIVRRGTCSFVQKAKNAAAKGAKYFLIYNNAPGTGAFTVVETPIKSAAMVTAEQGEKWIKLLAAGSKVELDITDSKTAEKTIIYPKNTVSGGAVSDFSSWGPTWDITNKPQFGAPGGQILSTYPLALGGYAVLSGTSMACPLAAAVYALIIEARGTQDPVLIENLLAATAKPQKFNDGKAWFDFLAPVPQQGAGLIQAYDAAYATTLLKPSGLSFKDTANFLPVLNFTLTNTGKEEITYEVSHVPAISMYTFNAGSIYPAPFPNEPVKTYATLKFSEDKVTVSAGESVTVEVLPTAPEGLDAARLPVWSGYIALKGSDGTSLSLPYQGVSGSLYEHAVLGSDATWIANHNDEDFKPVPADTTFTLPAAGANPKDTTIYPTISSMLALGTAQMTAHIVPMTTCPPGWVYEHWGTKTIGQPEGFPLSLQPRNLNVNIWNGKMDNEKWAPAGKYKIVIRALRINGNAEKKEDWDVAETPAFRIKYE